jgi:hypothetical protein
MIAKNVAELMLDHVVLEVESGKGRSKGLPTTPCSRCASMATNGSSANSSRKASASLRSTTAFSGARTPSACNSSVMPSMPRRSKRCFGKWLARLPHPYRPEDRQAGYRYALSILQAEFSLTQVLERPQTGRQFFEEVIRENLDLGRPDRVQLIFGRKVTRRTPGRFRTRVLTEGVVPSLQVCYKHSKIKQYHKEGRALRTETTVNDTYDFGIGRRLDNLPALREIGFSANRRLLEAQTLSHDCSIGAERFAALTSPQVQDGQRASALPFGQARVMALMHALGLFALLPTGFRNAELRASMAQLLGQCPANFSPGKMTYDLRRLRLHGLIERAPCSHRYSVTPEGLQTALFLTRAQARFFRPTFALDGPIGPPRSTRTFVQARSAVDRLIEEVKLAA